MSKPRTLVFVLLVVLFAVIFPVRAQECEGVFIDDTQSTVDLNRAAICEAASAWVERGFQVYVFLTDYDPVSEDAWFERLDQYEISNRILFADGRGSDTAIAFEASTAKPNTFAANISMPQLMLGQTPLWEDQILAVTKSKFRNLLSTGDYTHAFTEIMGSAYLTAYPLPTPVPPPTMTLPPSATPPATLTPQPSPTPIPTSTQDPIVLTQQAQEAQAQREAQEAQQRQTTSTLTGLVAAAVFVLVSGLIVVFVIVPLVKYWRMIKKYTNHINVLRNRSANLILGMEALLVGETVQETGLYGLWEVYGGTKYPDSDAHIRALLTTAREVFAKVSETFTELKRDTVSKVVETAQKWEVLYLTIVGTTAEILQMNQSQQEALLNPLTGLVAHDAKSGEIDNALFKQINTVFESLQGDETLGTALLVVKPEEVNANGILGLVAEVKISLTELQNARDAALPALENARDEIASAKANLVFEDSILNVQEAMGHAEAKFAEAELAMTDERWLDVTKASESVLKFTSGLEQIVTAYISAVKTAMERLAAIAALKTQGFKLDDLDGLEGEVIRDYGEFKAALVAGDLTRAEEFVREVLSDSENVFNQANARAQLHERNLARIVELAGEVARVQAFADGDVLKAWTTIETYPQSNWGESADSYRIARETLMVLFDDPANAQDLGSNLARLNALDGQQSFEQAREGLDKAFAQLQQSQRMLQSVIDHLKMIIETEKAVSNALVATRGDYEKAVARRDNENIKVDDDVDQWLVQAEQLIRKAEAAIENREFTIASQILEQVRQEVNRAYEEAGEQIAAINAAVEELATEKNAAHREVGEVIAANRNLPAAVQSREIAQMIEAVKQVLQESDLDNQRVSGLTDDGLLAALKRTTDLYRGARQQAQRVLARIRQAANEYQEAFDAAQRAIAEADGAINTAVRYVGNSDAGNAGDGALRRARSSLPAMVVFGVGLEALRQLQENARLSREAALQARREAQSRIDEVERQRREAEEERQRQKRAQEERDRKAAEDRAETLRKQQREAQERADALREQQDDARERAEKQREESRKRTESTSDRSRNSSLGNRKR